ncbi:MAG TPA: aminopeptidase P family protein [Elusimicrobiales bacterium]|nr:aminopeptidase P family protein [Elusimicrobiales bacterium]
MTTNEKRLRQLQALLRKNKLDALFVSRPLEAGFLTGFHLEGCLLAAGKDDVRAFLPKMLFDHFRSVVPFVKAEASDDPAGSALAFLKEKGWRKTAFEPEAETYLGGTAWRKKGLSEFGGLTASLRQCKEGDELAAVRKACAIAAKAFRIVKPRIKAGRTETSVALELEDVMQSMGATKTSFATIVGFGPNAAMPHHETSERRLKKNEAVLIDFGCVYKNYCSDMTRTFFYGKPDAEFRKVHAIVQKSHDLGIKAVRPGVSTIAVDKVCRDHIADAGYGQYFIHGTGHGVGLEIHEPPRLNTRYKGTLRKGMIVTVEPGIYLHGRFGVRIEDTVLVTGAGREILTK